VLIFALDMTDKTRISSHFQPVLLNIEHLYAANHYEMM